MNLALYFVTTPAAHDLAVASTALEGGSRTGSEGRDAVRFFLESSLPRLLARLGSGGVDALVVDARGERGVGQGSVALSLLTRLLGAEGLSGPLGREQIWLVVDGDRRGAELAFQAGRLRIMTTIAADGDGESVWADVVDRVGQALRKKGRGKIALCLAGGGIEGLFYELGALRALSSFLPELSLCDVDVHCGISAGAVLSAFLANGIGPAEIARGMARGEGKLDRIQRADIFDLNVKDFVRRCGARTWDVLRARKTPSAAMAQLVPSGVFAGKRLRDYLQRQLNKPGMTDSFAELPRPLYVGATDQDTAQHVVFGPDRMSDVPISLAVRASVGLTPFYAPQLIQGRYYSDGAFTRTTNMRVAVQAGATMVVLIEPLIPVHSEQAGFVQANGGWFSATQGLKALVSSRFDKAMPTLREMYPQVSFHLFQPDGAAMKMMSGSPMKYFWQLPIEELAYQETMSDIRKQRYPGLARDFERHGVRFVDPEVGRPAALLDDVRVA